MERGELVSGVVNPVFTNASRLMGLAGFVSGGGCWLEMHDGTRYLDTVGGLGALALGHNPPIADAVLDTYASQTRLPFIQVGPEPLAEELAHRLLAWYGLSSDDWVVLYETSGAMAVELAINLSFRHSGRQQFAGFVDGFHGITWMTVHLTHHAESPPFAALSYDPALWDSVLLRGNYAAIVLEPIQGSTLREINLTEGRRLTELCHASRTMLIVDEVLTGLGRTGRAPLIEKWGLDPDIICISKGLGAGLVPVSAVLVRRPIYETAVDTFQAAFDIRSTYVEYPLAMVCGLAAISALEENEARAATEAEALRSGIATVLDPYAPRIELRGRGHLLGLRCASEGVVAKLAQGLLERQVLTAVARDFRTLRLTPPLIWGRLETQSFVTQLEDVMAHMEEE